jgi:hypothetical protein
LAFVGIFKTRPTMMRRRMPNVALGVAKSTGLRRAGGNSFLPGGLVLGSAASRIGGRAACPARARVEPIHRILTATLDTQTSTRFCAFHTGSHV